MAKERTWRLPSFAGIANRLRLNPNDVLSVWQGKAIVAYWSRNAETKNNFGDALNPLLLELIFRKRAAHVDDVRPFVSGPTIYMAGSILDNLRNPSAVILGAGFKRRDSRVHSAPRRIFAVRGPLTRANLLKTEPVCPEVYCDPGLLLPTFFPKERRQGGLTGVIPHYVDSKLVARWRLPADKYSLIDIEGPVDEVISRISRCSQIISSSLHGIIAAHAYGVPATWIQISDRVVGAGFKFHDYYSSIGQSVREPTALGPDGEGIDKIRSLFVPDVDRNVELYLSAAEECRALLSKS